MKRRTFLKSGLSLSTVFLFNQPPVTFFPETPLKDSGRPGYAPGDKISKGVFVADKELKTHKLSDLCNQDAAVNFLYIYGGGAYKQTNRIGGIWCRDSFEDFHIMRFVHQKYDDSEVQIIPVACPPVYGGQYYGFEKRVFLDEPADSSAFKASAQAFIESTEKAIANEFVPVETYYDLRNRLLFNRRQDLKPGKGYKTIYPWQGRFRSDQETQKYGTPTIWLLSPMGIVLRRPFWGNIYHGDPYTIRYTIVDVDEAIQKFLK